MDRPHVSLKYERTFPYPIDVAYQWLTDYQDDDPTRTDTIVRKRDVVRRGDREVELDGWLDILGQNYRGKATVYLYPEEHRWKAVIGKGNWEFYYQLTPAGPNAAKLSIDYQMGSRRWHKRLRIQLAKPFIRRHLDHMWNGFDASMRRELGTPAPLNAPSR